MAKHALLAAASPEGHLLQQGRDMHASELDALGTATANGGGKAPSTEEGGRKRSSRCGQAFFAFWFICCAKFRCTAAAFEA